MNLVVGTPNATTGDVYVSLFTALGGTHGHAPHTRHT